MKKISVYRDFDIMLSQNGKYYASSEKLKAYLGFSKAVTDISEVKDTIDEVVDSEIGTENHENLEKELMKKYNNVENKIYPKRSKKMQRILLAVIVATIIALIFIIQGMLSGLEIKTISTSTQTFKNIALANRTVFDENHYPYILNADKVYEPLIDENSINNSINVKYIEANEKPYATVETKVRKKFYRSSKNPLTNLGRKFRHNISSPDEKTLKTVTVFQPVNYKKFVDVYDR
ncbi:hypothetical protein OGZ37_04330 [Lactococcus lactis]|uniref:hypothetical protein n=1 Tax=Lactococcus lactis TaxID=1358 RepID=UPI0024188864|nr:hypothetical protein [Lactococcus lactis]MDG4965806.1 hypothetical protein [Lactococcus lactis]